MLKRLINIIQGFFGIFLKGLEKNNPEALLEVEKENLRKRIATFNNGLANNAGQVEKLSAQAKALETEKNDLTLKIKALIQAEKRELAGQLAVRLQGIDKEHDQIVAQLTDSEKQYKELIKARDLSVKSAKDKIETLTRNINDMKIKQAAAEITEMANGMVSQIGSGADNLDRITALVEEERNKASGRLRVAKDSVDVSALAELELESNNNAEIALAMFESEMGMVSKPEGPAPVRVMG